MAKKLFNPKTDLGWYFRPDYTQEQERKNQKREWERTLAEVRARKRIRQKQQALAL